MFLAVKIHVSNTILRKTFVSPHFELKISLQNEKWLQGNQEGKTWVCRKIWANVLLLLSNTADRKGRSDAKQKLVELFDQRYDLDFLEESFYALCTAFQREHRKYQQVSPTKNWKFYNN